MSPLWLFREFVPERSHRHDGRREPGELLSELANVDVDRARSFDIRVAPEVLEEAPPGQDAPGRLEERLEEGELLGGELHRHARPLHLMGLPVEDELAEDEGGAPGLAALDPPPYSPDSGEELLRAERLHDIVVRADLEAHDPVRLIPPSRQDHDRDPLGPPIASDFSAEGEAIEPGKL